MRIDLDELDNIAFRPYGGQDKEKNLNPPSPEQRRAAQRRIVGFIDAEVEGDHARADSLIPVSVQNVVALEAAGLLVRALRLSGRGAEIWAQLRDQVTGTD